MPIELPDQDAQIEPVPTSGGGYKPEPELDRLSNIIKTFNDQFGNIPWTDKDRVHRLITKEIPARRCGGHGLPERQEALGQAERPHRARRELFRQFSDNESFKRWLTDKVFGLTYEGNAA